MSFADLTRKHFGSGLIMHYAAFDQQSFDRKLNEIQREIQQLQSALNRLQQANRRDYNRGFLSPFKGGNTIAVLSEPVHAEIANLHGWVLSLVESMFTLVRFEFGKDDVAALKSQWKNYF
jgi:hypothetical protein